MMARIEIDRPATGASKLLGLELIRFGCAMMVLVWHYQHFAMIGDGAAMLGPHSPLEGLLYPFYRFGLFGVQIFWCISGFIFYWKYADALAARRVEPARFFWLRFSRLYPLHFMTLIAVAAMQPVYTALAGEAFVFKDNGLGNFALHLLLADQWAGSRDMSFNGPIWSVSSEVMVYLGFFLLMRAFGRSRWIIAGAIGAGLWSMWSGNISPALICGAYFFAGGAAAEWLRSERFRRRPDQVRSTAMLMVTGCLLAAVQFDLTASADLLATWFMVITPPLLLFCAQDFRALARWQKPIQAAGNLTYSTYLIHFPIQLAVGIVVLASDIVLPVEEAWFLLAYLATSIILGRIVFVRFESPVQDWIRATALKPREAPVAA